MAWAQRSSVMATAAAALAALALLVAVLALWRAHEARALARHAAAATQQPQLQHLARQLAEQLPPPPAPAPEPTP